MSKYDYNKIFASNATSEIVWDDENYLRGWGYLGDVPPSYQAFDALQRINDLKMKEIFEIVTGIDENTENLIEKHNQNEEAHKSLFDKKLDKTGGTLTGDLLATGYNITATKFVGNLQGKADSSKTADTATKATNADNANLATNATHATSADNATNATKATQDSAGQAINTTYIKGITGNNATLTITKGNGTTTTVTINNVANSANATKTTQDKNGFQIDTGYLKRNQSTQNDMNACTVEGIYRFNGKLSNGWTSESWGTLLVFNNQYNGGSGVGGVYLVQLALPTDNRIWQRQRVNNGAWSRWSKIAVTTDITSNVDILKKVYPVGSIYMSTASTNPATLFGFGTWEAMPAGRVLLAQGTASWGTYAAGSTGGEATHKLTVGEMPSHNHSASTNTTGNHTHQIELLINEGADSSQYATNGGEKSGGHATTLTAGNHTHTVTINNTGSSVAHNNIQPYYTCYIWRRTA